MTLLKVWNPCASLQADGIGYNYAILILDRSINVPFPKSKIINLWQNATVRITVDGGSDRWLYWLEDNNVPISSVKHAELVTGDMDSIRKDTLKGFKSSQKTTVILTDDDSETDFTKALLELKKYVKLQNKQIDFVLTLTESSGRFDQIISAINTLHKVNNFWPSVDVFIVSNESISWLLWTGSHKIEVPSTVLKYSKWCSLIPFGGKANATTTGLKWNLDNTVLAFGQMVSTSNTFTDSPEITVNTDSPILWSMGLNCHVLK